MRPGRLGWGEPAHRGLWSNGPRFRLRPQQIALSQPLPGGPLGAALPAEDPRGVSAAAPDGVAVPGVSSSRHPVPAPRSIPQERDLQQAA